MEGISIVKKWTTKGIGLSLIVRPRRLDGSRETDCGDATWSDATLANEAVHRHNPICGASQKFALRCDLFLCSHNTYCSLPCCILTSDFIFLTAWTMQSFDEQSHLSHTTTRR